MANIFSVSNSEELMKALASAKGGDTIELAGGDYGSLSLIDGSRTPFDVTFDTEVTIRSADADQPASFSGMDLRGVSNLTFDSVVFDYQFSQDDPIYIKPFQVGYGSSDVTIQNSVFDGDVARGISHIDDGYGYGIGLNVRDASNISIDNNEFFHWHRGAVYTETENLSVVDNEVFAIRMDGFNFSEVQSVLIEGNYIHDFKGSEDSLDHRDMIQFWTNGTTSPTTDVVIRDNILDIGEGSYTQSIFMRNDLVDRGLAGSEMNYQNILIENNTIYNGHLHGITVGETDGLTIRNNAILHAAGDANDLSGGVSIPKINLKSASTSVVIEGNITSAISGVEGQSDWTVSGNALIQPSDYLSQFITSTTDAEKGSHGFIVLPDSEIEQLGAGSSGVQFPDAPDTLTPQFQVNSDEESAQALVFDASLTVGPLGPVSESDAEFQWDFGDGTTAVGRIVKHDFASVGRHDVTLTVITKDGTTAKAGFTAGIVGDDIVQFDAQAGLFEALAYGEETALDGSELSLQNTADGYALKLGGEGTQASVAAGELTRFLGTDSFEMTMTLKADSAESWGEVARIHTSFTASVDEGGNLQLDLFPDDGSLVRMASEGIALNDGGAHDVTIRFDGNASFAEILIDGVVVASEPVSGSLGGDPRSLDFGNPWGHQNFDGELSAFSLSADSRDYTVYDGEAPLDSGIETPSLDESSSTPVTEEPVITKDTTTAPESEETVVTKDTLKDDNVQNEFAETGTLTLNHIAQTVTLQRSYENPVVVAFVATENGGQPVNVRVSDISDNKLKLQLQEPNYLDGWHVNETVNYMVVEAGTWTLPDGTVFEAGTLNSDKLSTQGFETVGFNAEFDNAPVILSQVQSFNGGDFVATRQQGAGVDGFKLTMQEEEALNRGGHVTETLGWVAIEPGSGTAGDVSWQAGSISDITDVNASVGLGSSIAGGAKVIAGLSSYAGGDTAWARGNGSTATGFDVSVEEETSKDAETKHIRETVDYFVFNKAGTISGTPIMEEEAGLTEPLLQNGYQLDIASIETSETVKLHDDARITEAGSLSFDGEEDYISIGRLTEFEASHKIAFSVDFTSETSSGAERLIWNHSKVGLTLEDDGLRIHAQNNDGKFHEGFQIEGLGLNDGKQHNATVMVDAGADRLQVVVNNELVLDETGTDFDFVGGGGNEWGWSLGTAWNSWFEGEVHDFQVSDEFSFVEVSVNDETVLL